MNENMSVAFLVSSLRPGGMERLVVHLSSGLVKKGIDVVVICLQDYGELSGKLIKQGINVMALQSFRSMDFRALFLLKKILKEFKPSIINIHDYSSSPYGVAANLLSVNKPVVFTAHGLLYQGFEALRRRYGLISKGFSGITAVSSEVGKRHKYYLAYKEKIAIIKNGIPPFERDEEKRLKIRSELEISDKEFLFLAVGNPRPEKGFEDLIGAASIIKSRGLELKIVVAGKLKKDNYCEMLLGKLKEESLEGVVNFLGFRSDIESLYSAADGFVLSSRSEGMPMVILEAMTAGLPIVTTSVGGIPETVKDTAIIVNPSNPMELALGMEDILAMEDRGKNQGKRARALALKEYGNEKMVEEYMNYYKTIIKKGKTK